jgi:hypothetical protein
MSCRVIRAKVTSPANMNIPVHSRFFALTASRVCETIALLLGGAEVFQRKRILKGKPDLDFYPPL